MPGAVLNWQWDGGWSSLIPSMRSIAVISSMRSVAEIGCKLRYVGGATLSTVFFDSETGD
jgi:hypothetical protein